MIRQSLFFLYLFCSFSVVLSQQFIRVGSPVNVNVEPSFGILLAGGATDNDDGMRWLAQRANGGDVVVLRASGGDGYNNYILSELGVKINSVTTIIITSSAQASNPAVCDAVRNAHLIFITGGNQWNYYNDWKGTCLQSAINEHVTKKLRPIGGTSAGLAILGEVVFTAENNSVLSSEALQNPYHSRVRLSRDFLSVPFLENVVTDSHYDRLYSDNMNRRGRHMVFMARMVNDWQIAARGIGVEEYTAVAVDENGLARVFGDIRHNDFAYFINTNGKPETIAHGTPLHWVNNENAATVYSVRGNKEGSNTFDLSDWNSGSGGNWLTWFVENGVMRSRIFQPVSTENVLPAQREILAYPNPLNNTLNVVHTGDKEILRITITDLSGREVMTVYPLFSSSVITADLSALSSGIYLLQVFCPVDIYTKKIVKD